VPDALPGCPAQSYVVSEAPEPYSPYSPYSPCQSGFAAYVARK
jgi:hypothetical protein